MKRARFSEEQIIAILRENEAGAKAGELARKHGVSEGTIYAWKAKFGGMSVSDAQRLRSLALRKGRCRWRGRWPSCMAGGWSCAARRARAPRRHCGCRPAACSIRQPAIAEP